MSNNKRIAKNTLSLYFRMIITMLASLYTSRIVLKTLGVEDFGIYNIVGGVVVLFSFLNNALTQASQRFLTFSLGENDLVKFKNIFNLSILVYLLLSIAVFILAETFGLWFLNTKLNIQAERMNAANWVYQFTIVAFMFNLLRTPFNAVIIAHEKMSFYAYISILEVILKLLIVYFLVVFTYDKLILYSILLTAVHFVVLCIFIFYVKIKFSMCKFCYYWDFPTFKKMAFFSGWSLFGSLSVMSANQGVNVLLNIFFGVFVNAAVGISNQVCGAVQQFISNFQMAFNPQITKYYAANDRDYLLSLIFKTSKFSLFLIFIISLPILLKTEAILKLWLGIVPNYTVFFCQLILISMIIESLSGPLWMVVQATGKIKKYQIYMSFIKFTEIIGVYVLFKFGLNPVYAFIVRCLVSCLSLICRLFLLKNLIKFPSKVYIRDVLLKSVIICGVISFITYIVCDKLFKGDSIFDIIYLTSCSLLISVIIIFSLGLNSREKQFIVSGIKKGIYK